MPYRGQINLERIIEADCVRDHLARMVVDRALDVLSDLVQQLVLHHNPARIILTGPLIGLGARLPEAVRSRLSELESYPAHELPEIVNSRLGVYVGAMGAAALAIQNWRPAFA
jgi:predicted NBD/HSP70 family sugar kinase